MHAQMIRGIQIKAITQLSWKNWTEYIHLHPYVEDKKQKHKEVPQEYCSQYTTKESFKTWHWQQHIFDEKIKLNHMPVKNTTYWESKENNLNQNS